MSTSTCVLARCKGKRGCICPKKPPPGFFSGIKDNGEREKEKLQLPSIPSALVQPKKKLQPSSKSSSKPKSDEPLKTVAQVPIEVKIQEKMVGSVPIASTSSAVDRNGNVTVRFNHYKKPFVIVNGCLSSDVIDGEYFISFAYPKCKIHLSKYGPSDFGWEDSGLTEKPLEKESQPGTYVELEVDQVYFVVVEEDEVLTKSCY